ncbi:hypothetical protein ACVWZV_002246 [Bradyrhizobium sp. GM5.1]
MDNQGYFRELALWFCSVDCYNKAIRRFLNKRFDPEADPYDDPEVLRRMQDAYDGYRASVARGFIANLPNLFRTENKYIEPRITAALDDFQTQRANAIVHAEDEVYKRVLAEWQHELMKLAEAQEKEDAKQSERQQKEDQKQRKIDEEDARRVAEEERWRPKPFNV